jgi:hypothetical protein
MTAVTIVAVRAAADGHPAGLLAADGTTVVGRLLEQLARLGVHDVQLVTRASWRAQFEERFPTVAVRALAQVGEPLSVAPVPGSTDGTAAPVDVGGASEVGHLLLHADVVVADQPLRRLLSGPPAALVGPAADGPAPACRAGRDRVLTLEAEGATRFLGVLRLADLPSGLPETNDPLAVLLQDTLRAGHPVRAVPRRSAPWARPDDEVGLRDALRRLDAVDEEHLRLEAAVKAEDGWFTTHLVSPYSRYLARAAARRGSTPDQVTIASLLVGAAAAGAFAVGTRPWMVAGALLLQVAFTLDCVDGQLARYAGAGTALGGWLDAMFDRLKEFLVYAGLAAGAVRVDGNTGVWQLALAGLVLQTFRHHVDLGYEAFELDRWDRSPPARTVGDAWRSDAADDRAGPGAPGLAGRLVAGAGRIERAGALKWAKRIVVLPIGERFALISLVAAVGQARQVFWVLLAWGTVALGYTATGRLARSST